jgi:hypothetical protein
VFHYTTQSSPSRIISQEVAAQHIGPEVLVRCYTLGMVFVAKKIVQRKNTYKNSVLTSVHIITVEAGGVFEWLP